jgi:hypothetical protein
MQRVDMPEIAARKINLINYNVSRMLADVARNGKAPAT